MMIEKELLIINYLPLEFSGGFFCFAPKDSICQILLKTSFLDKKHPQSILISTKTSKLVNK